MDLQFESTTQAALRYIELYLLLSTPRSIPLGTKKTHVGKTDSRGKWQRILKEFAHLVTVFPKSHTDEWYLMTVNLTVSAMPEERRKFYETLTEKKISPYLFERRTDQLFGHLKHELHRHNMLT